MPHRKAFVILAGGSPCWRPTALDETVIAQSAAALGTTLRRVLCTDRFQPARCTIQVSGSVLLSTVLP